MDTAGKSAIELVSALRRRELSASALLEETIERAERVVPVLNPFAIRLYDQAREAAKAADQQLARGTGGPLCGLPVTIKDSQWLAGVPCANGSRVLKDFVPDQTCAAVSKLEEAGAVIFAKTTCPEFGFVGITDSELHGPTVNPWNPDRTSGGSSGGAGVTLAAGLGALSLGGDGGGSIRIPAAFCGVVGLKPSFGLVKREPCFPSWKSLVCYGPMARHVADARLMLTTLVDAEQAAGLRRTSHHDLGGLKLVVSDDLGFAPLDDDARRAFHAALARLADAGAELIFDHPHLSTSAQTWSITATYDAWLHEKEYPLRFQHLGELTQAILAFGAQFSEADFQSAQEHRKVIAQAYAEMYERTGAAALITPTVGCEAFPLGRLFPERIGDTVIELPWIDWAGFLYDANLIGMPACAVPIGLGDEGLPLSIQVLGPPGSDGRILDIAEQIEDSTDWEHPYTNGISEFGGA